MSKLNRAELDHLERRELQLTVLAAVFVLVLAAGLAAFMYPLVFVHPEGNKWTLRVAFFGFCALTLLFVGYLVDRQRMVRQLKQHLLEELERNVELQPPGQRGHLAFHAGHQSFLGPADHGVSPRGGHGENFVVAAGESPAGPNRRTQTGVDPASWGDAAKAMSRKLRPTDSIYRLSTDLFALVLPETDTVNAQRVALRLQEELQVVRAKFGGSYDINCYNYPEQVHSAHELEDIVRSLLPEQPGWDIPVPLASI